MKRMRTVDLLGVRIHDASLDEIFDILDEAMTRHDKTIVANVNAHAMNLAYEIAWLRDFLNGAGLVFCDGYGVLLATCLIGECLRQRNTPVDWMPFLAQRATVRGYRLYLLGALPGVADEAAKVLVKSYPGLEICGVRHGYFDTSSGSAENDAVIEHINAASPDLLLVGMGMPLQERWLRDNIQRLDVHVAMPVGALFDYLSGRIRRPPRWMTTHGLEWLGRLIIEPRRLWRRYLIGNPLFVYRVLKQRFGDLPEID
jgi:N-acetylglucosaminyldiphosphoundecaprenol N-acetyl-beta-D-mannosaminyltransferase